MVGMADVIGIVSMINMITIMSNVNTTDILPILTIIVTASIVYAILIIDTISTLYGIYSLGRKDKIHRQPPPTPGQCLVPIGVGGSRIPQAESTSVDARHLPRVASGDGRHWPAMGGRGRADLSLQGLRSAPDDRPKGRSLYPAVATWTESPVAPFAFLKPCNVIKQVYLMYYKNHVLSYIKTVCGSRSPDLNLPLGSGPRAPQARPPKPGERIDNRLVPRLRRPADSHAKDALLPINLKRTTLWQEIIQQEKAVDRKVKTTRPR